MTKPAPNTLDPLSQVRRDSEKDRQAGCFLDGLSNSRIIRTTTNISSHGAADLLVGGLGHLVEWRNGRHHLPGPAVAALGYIKLRPGSLNRFGYRGVKSFDGGDGCSGSVGDPGHAGALRFAINVNRTSTALRDSASKLCADQFHLIAQHPKQWCLRIRLNLLGNPIDRNFDGHGDVRQANASESPRLSAPTV